MDSQYFRESEPISLEQPDLLLIHARDAGATTYGCDQDWYADHWQRQAGCGPCTAATVLYYLSRRRPDLARLYTAASNDRSDFMHYMSEIWHYVTPGHMGVNEASILANGVQSFAASQGIVLQSRSLRIPKLQQATRPAFTELVAFIRQGLATDCPVAFLNLSNGQLTNLDHWHWVTITGLDCPADSALPHDEGQPGDMLATIADSGDYKVINLSLWYRTTLLGGAVVYFDVGAPADNIASPPSL
jgi:hypothetical protein